MAEPTANPNAFSAPAEGFGQTISFAFDPRGEVPQQRPITSQGPRISASAVQGLQRSDSRVDVSSAPDPTAQLLMKAGESILAKQLDAARSAEFVQGMQRAMSGEAITEVRDSVPWYARIFGDTPTIEGARAYTAQDMVNKTLTRETANIKQLEQLGPEAAGKHFSQVLQGAQTGDRATDGVIIKQMTEQMPALMKAQAKAHYGYNQRKASAALADSIQSGAGALQQFGEMYAGDQVSEADMKLRAQQYVMSVIPPEGIDEESYQKTLTSSIIGMAGAGQFHAIEALRESGVLRALTTDQANRIESTILSKATAARDRYAFQYSGMIAEIKSDAAHPPEGQTQNQLSARIDRANDAFKKLTGSPVGLFSSDQKADLLTQGFNAFKAEESRAARNAEILASREATATAKAIAAADTQETIRSLVSTGDVLLAKKLPGVSGDEVDLEVFKMVRADPNKSGPFLRDAWSKGYVSNLVADSMQQGLKLAAGNFAQNPASTPPDTFFEAVTAYRAMSQQGGPAFANAYFGEHAKAMSYASYMFGSNVLDHPDAASIYQRAMTANNFKGETLTAKEQTALVAKVASSGSSWLPKFLGGHNLREDSIRFLSEEVGNGASQWMANGLSKEEAVAQAMNDVLGPDTSGGRRGGARGEIIGGYYIRRDPASSQETLASLMEGGNGAKFTAIPEESRGEIFNKFLIEGALLPKDLGTTQINRLPDAGGTAQFVVNAKDKDGKTIIRTFTGLQLQEYAAKQTRIARTGRFFQHDPDQPVKSGYGPAITFKPGEGAPSIYADAAEWAAYRAKQQKPTK